MKASKYLKGEILYEIFEEMCKRVGASLDDIELVENNGKYEFPYYAYEWTEEEESDFRKWLTNYLYKNRKKFGMSYMTKKRIDIYETPLFLLMYGWKYKQGEEK